MGVSLLECLEKERRDSLPTVRLRSLFSLAESRLPPPTRNNRPGHTALLTKDTTLAKNGRLQMVFPRTLRRKISRGCVNHHGRRRTDHNKDREDLNLFACLRFLKQTGEVLPTSHNEKERERRRTVLPGRSLVSTFPAGRTSFGRNERRTLHTVDDHFPLYKTDRDNLFLLSSLSNRVHRE